MQMIMMNKNDYGGDSQEEDSDEDDASDDDENEDDDRDDKYGDTMALLIIMTRPLPQPNMMVIMLMMMDKEVSL